MEKTKILKGTKYIAVCLILSLPLIFFIRDERLSMKTNGFKFGEIFFLNFPFTNDLSLTFYGWLPFLESALVIFSVICGVFLLRTYLKPKPVLCAIVKSVSTGIYLWLLLCFCRNFGLFLLYFFPDYEFIEYFVIGCILIFLYGLAVLTLFLTTLFILIKESKQFQTFRNRIPHYLVALSLCILFFSMGIRYIVQDLKFITEIFIAS